MTDELKEAKQLNMEENTTKTEGAKQADAKQADKEWEDLQRELETLGEQVKSLRDHAGALGETVLGNMELRFQDVLSRAHAYRNESAAQMTELQKQVVGQADQTQATLTEQGKKSAEMAKDKARELWDRAEPLREGAQEVGKGFLRAWSEIAASFSKAAEKVQSERAKGTSEDGDSKPTGTQTS